MANVDLSPITGLAAQIQSWKSIAATATDPTVKAMAAAQADALTNQMIAGANHAEAQIEAQNNVLNALDLHDTISAIGATAPAIFSLFVKH